MSKMKNLALPLAILVAVLAALLARPEFFDVPSLALIVGGSILVTCFSYSRDQLRQLIIAIRSMLADRQPSIQEHLQELARLTQLYRLEGIRGLESQELHLPDAFMRRAVTMVVDLHRTETIQAVLQRELATILSREEVSRQILLLIAKLLPSFGLIGTLSGLVLLLKNVATNNVGSLPGALSLAVLTTLYGAVLANVVIAPLAARLHARAVENETKMRLTIEWVLVLLRGESAPMSSFRETPSFAFSERGINRSPDWGTVPLQPDRQLG
ncbi:MAG TPA: MotA/TolQ/ExbB proton channel family protein [Candidatus Binatia bacterium]|jgi:chemotaxis protein MotA